MRNQLYEEVLTKQGLAFSYQPKVALLDIDARKGLANQARLEEPLDKELIEQYRAALREKCQFPPLVLWRPGKGRWIPVDGNQRLAAYAAEGWKYADAYLLDTQDPMIANRVTWSFNNKVNGKRLSREECVHHAVTMVRTYGATHANAAKEWGLPEWAVKRECKNLELKEALQRHKVKVTPTLTEEKLHDLAPLLTVGEDVLATAARAVAETGVGKEEIAALNREVKAARTHEAKVKAVEKFAASEAAQRRRAETKGGTVKARTPRPSERLVRGVKDLLRLLDGYPRAALRPAGKDFREARGHAHDLVNKLVPLFGLGALLPDLPEERTA